MIYNSERIWMVASQGSWRPGFCSNNQPETWRKMQEVKVGWGAEESLVWAPFLTDIQYVFFDWLCSGVIWNLILLLVVPTWIVFACERLMICVSIIFFHRMDLRCSFCKFMVHTHMYEVALILNIPPLWYYTWQQNNS